MLTKDQLDSIAKFIIATAPGYDFMMLITAQDGPNIMGVVSNIPRSQQPLMAMEFAQSAMGIETGDFVAVEPTKSH
jgi:hypothetical protein